MKHPIKIKRSSVLIKRTQQYAHQDKISELEARGVVLPNLITEKANRQMRCTVVTQAQVVAAEGLRVQHQPRLQSLKSI